MRRHLDELARNLKIHALHFRQIGKILVEYVGDLDVAYLDFVFGEEHQNKAERTLEVLKLVLFPNNALKMKAGIFH